MVSRDRVASDGVGTYYFGGPQNTELDARWQPLTGQNNVCLVDDFLIRGELENAQVEFDSFRRHPICCLESELKRNFTGAGGALMIIYWPD